MVTVKKKLTIEVIETKEYDDLTNQPTNDEIKDDIISHMGGNVEVVNIEVVDVGDADG